MSRVFWDHVPARNQHLSRDLYAVAGQPCFITIRAFPGVAPFADARFARIAVDCLLGQREKSQCRVDVYCVMPDHVHFVVTPVSDGASSLTFVERYKGWCSRELARAGWQGKVWQPRWYDHVVRQEESMEQIADYILGNPVRRGLVGTVEEFAWSGFGGQEGTRET